MLPQKISSKFSFKLKKKNPPQPSLDIFKISTSPEMLPNHLSNEAAKKKKKQKQTGDLSLQYSSLPLILEQIQRI